MSVGTVKRQRSFSSLGGFGFAVEFDANFSIAFMEPSHKNSTARFSSGDCPFSPWTGHALG